MQEHPYDSGFSQFIIETIRQVLGEPSFCERHRRRLQDFTRQRHLGLMRTVVFLLEKTVRSVQLHVHEFFARLGEDRAPITASAWSQGRLKLRHTAFLELNQRAILEPVYATDSVFAVKRWRGHRLVAIDSSLLHLPNPEAVGREFGWVSCQNQQGACGRYAQGRLSVLTDVLNRIAKRYWWAGKRGSGPWR